MAEEPERNYRIEDIAQELGVSKTTVSRALSGKGRIGRDTVERVQALAKKRGYRPNVMARGLVRSKTYNLGLVMPMEFATQDAPFFRECMAGIYEEAEMHDYDILLSMEKKGDLSSIRRLIGNHKVDGVILPRTMIDSDTEHFLQEQSVPLVVIGPSDGTKTVFIDNPNREASRELTEILLMKGIRRLALVGGDRTHYVTVSRERGFSDAFREQGLVPNPSIVFWEVDHYQAALKAVERALQMGIDGMVCMDDTIAQLVLGCLKEKNVKIPSQVRLASLYDSPQLEKSVPAITGLRFDTRGLGRNACIRMLEMLGEDIKEEESSLNYQVILRESTK